MDNSSNARSENTAASPADAAGTITCRRCGETQPKMAERPFKGPLGERVWAEVCETCWRKWLHTGTKVVNEFRLDFSNPKHGEIYDQHMKEFLNLVQP